MEQQGPGTAARENEGEGEGEEEDDLFTEVTCEGPLGSLGQEHGRGSRKRKMSSPRCV